jgi:hypothetical protein
MLTTLTMPILALLACRPEPAVPDEGPLGIPLVQDGLTYAGAAAIDLTPLIREVWTDTNGDHSFQGCHDDPGCAEPFDDVDGDGWFDAVWIGGFGPLRPAVAVHDPVWARAVVLARDGEYVALVALDLVGLGHPRIWQARDALAEDGFDPVRLIVSSSHDHQGPDTMGLWGNPLIGIPGFDLDYQQRVAEAIEQSVRDAAEQMVPIELTVGSVAMRDRGPWMNGPEFGGKNPDPRFHGMIHDGRDPVLVSDQLLVLHGQGEQGSVFTLTNWSGHPEVRASDNNEISSDWVGVTREVIEAELGGIALHVPESLGGMQSALHGDLPLVLDDGTFVYQTCDAAAVADPLDADCFGEAPGADRVDSDGDRVPVWAEQDSWEFVTSHGWHIGLAALDALAAGERVETAPLRVGREQMMLPITNAAYNLLGPTGLFDIGIEQAVVDPELCPESLSEDVLGCFPAHVFRVEIGEAVGLLSVPGELLPELAWGFPEEDPRWGPEASDPAQRGPTARYFPQHDADCTALSSYEECRTAVAVGDCDCLTAHAWPYRISEDPGQVPLLELLDTEHRAMIGMADSYFSYIIPEPDFNKAVSLFTDDGDHYEDTVSASVIFGDRVLEAHQRLAERFEP